MTVKASWVGPCWGRKPDTCVLTVLGPLLSSRAEMQTQPLTWPTGPVQILMGNSAQIGSQSLPLPHRSSVGRPEGHPGKFPLFFWLSLIHFLIEFSHYNLPFQSCREHHITEVHRGTPHFLLEQHPPQARNCACLQSAVGSLAIVPTPAWRPVSCQGLHSPFLSLSKAVIPAGRAVTRVSVSIPTVLQMRRMTSEPVPPPLSCRGR